MIDTETVFNALQILLGYKRSNNILGCQTSCSRFGSQTILFMLVCEYARKRKRNPYDNVLDSRLKKKEERKMKWKRKKEKKTKQEKREELCKHQIGEVI